MINGIKTDFDNLYEELSFLADGSTVFLSYNQDILVDHKQDLEGKSGIYYIRNIDSKHGYVGQASDLYDRLMGHLRRANNDAISDSPALHRALAKSGLKNFEFQILEFTKNLNDREKY